MSGGTEGWEKYKGCDDPSWVEASEPFLILFSDKRPFTWEEIFEWGEDNDIHKYWCRQIVSYLELKSLIWADISCSPVLWMKCGNWTIKQARKGLKNCQQTGFEKRDKKKDAPFATGGDIVMGSR